MQTKTTDEIFFHPFLLYFIAIKQMAITPMAMPIFCLKVTFSPIIKRASIADEITPPPFTQGNTTTPGNTPEMYTLIAFTIPKVIPDPAAILRNPKEGTFRFVLGIKRNAVTIPVKVQTTIKAPC